MTRTVAALALPVRVACGTRAAEPVAAFVLDRLPPAAAARGPGGAP